MLRKLLVGLCVIVGLSQLPQSRWSAEQPVVAANLQISRAQFGQYINEWSEPEGYFDSDNFISNETSYLHVIDDLRNRVKPGGVYVGVGPDQNFSYIAQTRPAMAIVIDIRRQNMLEHLLYKALFDMAATRAQFLALLFSVEPPAIDSRAALPALLDAIRSSPSRSNRYDTNLKAIEQKLTQGYGLKLSAADLEKIQYIYSEFHREGLDLRFSSIGRNNAANYPTYESLLVATDRNGRLQSYLASEDLFLWMKTFEAENRLVPIVGDFSGTRAFKAAGAFLARSGLAVSTFYTSNVEFYIFNAANWPQYIANVRALPMADKAVFIRAYFSGAGPRHPLAVTGHRSTTLVHDVAAFLKDYRAGKILNYWDVVNR